MLVNLSNVKIRKRKVVLVKADKVVQEVAKLCRSFRVKEVILYGLRLFEVDFSQKQRRGLR